MTQIRKRETARKSAERGRPRGEGAESWHPNGTQLGGTAQELNGRKESGACEYRQRNRTKTHSREQIGARLNTFQDRRPDRKDCCFEVRYRFARMLSHGMRRSINYSTGSVVQLHLH